ncbi:MAG: DUF2780 domain-containing protein [Deltaproteobacteria bacterium]|nr:DUF2780 domain-containing protein [Deltaproteobacteria bacterium]
MEILNMLTEQLGVTEAQAKGGAGAIFNLAKEKLGDADFGKVAEAVPGMEELIGAAPASGGLAGVVGGLASKLGGGAGNLGSLASLAGGFKNLGLDSGMVGKFIPIILSFVQSKGGDSIKSLLAGVLK